MAFLRRSLATLALTVFGFGAGAAFTTSVSAQTVTSPLNDNAAMPLRGERASRHDIHHAERRLRRLIADLNRDQRDYGGHRANAVDLLQQAESQLQQAVQYDNRHPNQ